MPNLRKVGAYVYQALLDLGSQELGVPKDQLSVKDGIISGGGKSVSYGDLVKNKKLNLTIPVKGDLGSMGGLTVEGNPPLKPVNEYTVVGKSFPNSVTVSKVTAKETWVTDVRLPGMMHARVVHPKTLGSKLISAGPLDKGSFPQYAGHCQGEPGWGSGAYRVGGDQSGATSCVRHQMERMEGASRGWPPVSIPAGRCGLEGRAAGHEQEFQR